MRSSVRTRGRREWLPVSMATAQRTHLLSAWAKLPLAGEKSAITRAVHEGREIHFTGAGSGAGKQRARGSAGLWARSWELHMVKGAWNKLEGGANRAGRYPVLPRPICSWLLSATLPATFLATRAQRTTPRRRRPRSAMQRWVAPPSLCRAPGPRVFTACCRQAPPSMVVGCRGLGEKCVNQAEGAISRLPLFPSACRRSRAGGPRWGCGLELPVQACLRS